uniref:THAP-type domain-containing protein n=1 Tax=Timema genevievae TaxID=629358 RepID=A0A7R9KBT1_TIMGE|nr:unnamed protein product [Timema genevievae]
MWPRDLIETLALRPHDVDEKVCELHFQNNDIQRETECYDEKTGKKITVSLKRPRLQDGAIPSQQPNCPEYLSSSRPTRENVDQRRERIDNDNLRRAIAQLYQQI